MEEKIVKGVANGARRQGHGDRGRRVGMAVGGGGAICGGRRGDARVERGQIVEAGELDGNRARAHMLPEWSIVDAVFAPTRGAL